MNRQAKKRRAKFRTQRVEAERVLAVLGNSYELNPWCKANGYKWVPLLTGGAEMRPPESSTKG